MKEERGGAIQIRTEDRGGSGKSMAEALNLALIREMEINERIVVFGEDVARNGGVFRVTENLLERFGSDRVFDSSLAEEFIAGVAVGMAAGGLRPVAEIQFSGFIYPCIDQVLNHGGRLATRTRGRIHCPFVLRSPCGGGIHAPEHHSESPESLFAHMPGIHVAIPSSPKKAYGLMLAALRCEEPVVFLEPTALYRSFREPVQDDGEALPLDKCFVDRAGKDVTLIAWGRMLPLSLDVAEEVKREISVEVIDVASMNSLDMETILQSLEKTGRCVIVQEAPRISSVSSEIGVQIAEKGLLSLYAPIKRVTGWDTPIPLAKLEKYYFPDKKRIEKAVREVYRYDKC